MEVINSFFSNIKDKLTNPYFGTLIIILFFSHWELLYSIFNFNASQDLNDKISFIQEYISENITWTSFFKDATLALGLMLTGYLVIVGTRSLVIWVEFRLMPIITGVIISKNVVRKSEYDEVVQQREEYFDQYEEQRENVRRFSKTIDEQTEQIKQKDEDLLKQTKIIGETLDNFNNSQNRLDTLQNIEITQNKQIAQLVDSNSKSLKESGLKSKKLEQFDSMFFNEKSKKFYDSIDKFPPEITEEVHRLKQEEKWNSFIYLGDFFRKGGSIGGELLSEMINRGLAFERGNSEELTPKGKIIYTYREIFNPADSKSNLLLSK